MFDRIFGSEVQFGGSVLKYAFPGPFYKPTRYDNSNIFKENDSNLSAKIQIRHLLPGNWWSRLTNVLQVQF